MLREQVDKFDTDWLAQEIAKGIDLASTPADELSRGQQWKVWLDAGEKTAFDLIAELEKSPGRPRPGESIGDIEVPFYQPGPIQWKAHKATEKIIYVAGGWRAGKSKWLAAQLLPYMFRSFSHVLIVANDYKLARAEFGYIQMWLEWLKVPMAKPPSKPKEGSWQIVTAWQATLETMTGKDEDKIEMVNLNAAGIAEAGQTDKGLMLKVLGRTMQKRGRIFISGSMVESQPWYVNAISRYQNGDEFGDNKSFSIPSFDNQAIYPLGEDDPQLQFMKRELPEDEYARKVLALPMPPTGLVFKEFDLARHVVPITMVETTAEDMRKAIQAAYSPFESSYLSQPRPEKDGFRIKSWEVPEHCPVEIAVDPGYDPGKYAVLAIVRTKNEILVIDEVYESHMFGDQVIQICQDRPWWPRVRGGTIDVAAKQHQANMSQHEVWRKATGFTLQTIFVPIPDGIERYRSFLFDPKNGQPRMFIDPRCEQFIWEHSQYKYPKNREEGNLRVLPIDRHNHAIKAMTYYIVKNFKFSDSTGGTTSRRYVDKKPMTQQGGAREWMYEENMQG